MKPKKKSKNKRKKKKYISIDDAGQYGSEHCINTYGCNCIKCDPYGGMKP